MRLCKKLSIDLATQGSKLKKILGRLLATSKEKMVAKCKNVVTRLYKNRKSDYGPLTSLFGFCCGPGSDRIYVKRMTQKMKTQKKTTILL